MLDPEVSTLLETLNLTFPHVHEMTGAEARAAVVARRQPVTNTDDVRSAEDRNIAAGTGSIGVRIYQPHGGTDRQRPVVVFCHGGGFVFCDLDTHDAFCRALSRHTEAVVVSVDYRLAPEHRAPTAVRDAYTALCWVAEHAGDLGADPERIVVMGDSAGGNLAAAICLLARDEHGPGIAGQVLLYPVLDPECDTGSFRDFGAGYFNTTAAMRWYWVQYLGGDRLPEPAHVVAPARAASHADLPPAVVVTAGSDPLHDEGAAYAATLASAGVEVTHRDYPGVFHGFLTIMPLRAAESARQILWRDVRRLLGADFATGTLRIETAHAG